MNQIPILGQKALVPTMGPVFLPRHLDGNGLIEAAEVIDTPEGRRPRVARSQFMDGDELLAEIRDIVKEELAIALNTLLIAMKDLKG